MARVARTCSECGGSLAGRSPRTVTCSVKCRSARSRRVQRANDQVREFAEANNAGAQEIADIVRREAPDVVTRVMHGQLEPIVREALTEDVLRAIHDMVGLTPRAVAALHEDLESEDSTIRQRAYTLLIKYTVGHPALVKSDDTDGSKQLVVNFNLPRPDAEPDPEPQVEAEAVEEELALCDMCNTEKPTSEFVAGSTRCKACFEDWKARVMAEFA